MVPGGADEDLADDRVEKDHSKAQKSNRFGQCTVRMRTDRRSRVVGVLK